jgi:hypothetical protein
MNPSTQETETKDLEVEDSMGNIGRLCLNITIQTHTKKY